MGAKRHGIIALSCAAASAAGAGVAAAAVIGGPVVNPANAHSYFLLDAASWTASEAEAVTLGGHLVTINDAAENLFIFNTFAAPATGPQRNIWLGFTDQASEGNFVWISGEPVTYTNWGPGEPNDAFGAGEDYAHMLAVQFSSILPSQWNDVPDATPDRFGVVEVIPEPAGLALLAIGGLCLTRHRPRRD